MENNMVLEASDLENEKIAMGNFNKIWPGVVESTELDFTEPALKPDPTQYGSIFVSKSKTRYSEIEVEIVPKFLGNGIVHVRVLATVTPDVQKDKKLVQFLKNCENAFGEEAYVVFYTTAPKATQRPWAKRISEALSVFGKR